MFALLGGRSSQNMRPNQTLQTVEAQLIPDGPWYRLAANIGALAGCGSAGLRS
jgi:hypothetical protein